MEIENFSQEKLSCWKERGSNTLIAESDEYFISHPKETIRIISPRYQDIAPAFRAHGQLIIGCADEGIRDDLDLPSLTPGSYHFLHIIGSGIVSPKVIGDLAKTVHGIYGFTAHEGCAGVVARAHKLGIEDVNAYAEEFAKEQAEKYGTRYLGMIPMKDMKRPAKFHDAFGVYLDGSGVLDQTRSPLLPHNCFTLSPVIFQNNAQALESELKNIVAIAQGEHGLGLKELNPGSGFSDAEPFYIFAIGKKFDSSLSISRLTEMATSVTLSSHAVKIVAFEAP